MRPQDFSQRGREFLGTKLFQKLDTNLKKRGTNLKKKEQNSRKKRNKVHEKRYTTREKGTKLKKKSYKTQKTPGSGEGGLGSFCLFCMIQFFFLALLVPKSSITATSTFVIFLGSGVPVSRTSTFWYTLGLFIHFVLPASL